MEFDQQALVDIFVAEATDGLDVLWGALNPEDGSDPTPTSLQDQFIVAHRIKGAALQYGYQQLAEVGGTLENALEHLDQPSARDWPSLVAGLRDLVLQMKAEVERIGEAARASADHSAPATPSPEGAPPADLDVEARQGSADSLPDDYLRPDIDAEVLSYFEPEVQEYLDAIEAALLRLEKSPRDRGTIQSLFRTLHTLKGSAYTVGFQVIGDVAHPLEDLLGLIQEGGRHLTSGSIDLIFRAVDAVRLLMTRDANRLDQTRVKLSPLFEALRHPGEAPATASSGPEAGSVELLLPERAADGQVVAEGEMETLYDLGLEAEEHLAGMESALVRLENNEEDDEAVHLLLQSLRSLKSTTDTVQSQALAEITHNLLTFVENAARERAPFTAKQTDICFRTLDAARALLKPDPATRVETRDTLETVLQDLRELSRSAGVETSALVGSEQAAPGEGNKETSPRLDMVTGPQPKAAGKPEESRVIRVSQHRLERLLNLVGELVISRGRLDQRLVMLEQLSQEVLAYRSRMLETIRGFEMKHEFSLPKQSSNSGEWIRPDVPALAEFGSLELDKYDDFNILARRIAEVAADIGESMAQLNISMRSAREDMSQLQHLTTGIRNEIASTRMVAIGTSFLRFRRAVREMARATHKEVTLVTSGEQTEVDTTVVDKLVDPLIHLVRNAIYHGIEPPAVRVSTGKPPAGTVHLKATHRSSQVIIEVEDDGAGLDLERIKERAVALRLITPDAAHTLSRSEIINLIFLPGFSTAERVGDHAGRGIGMDVVKNAVQNMNGHIEVESVPGQGTKFTLELPFTLLVSTALLVRVGTHRYAIPLPAVREVILPAQDELQTLSGQRVLRYMDESIPVESLAHLLHGEPVSPKEMLPVVIARTPAGPLGLMVDELLGRQEIVIKTMGTLKALQNSCFGGATVDPEGRVLLVLDVARLTERREYASRPGPAQSAVLPQPEISGEQDFAQVEGHVGPARSILLIDDSLSVRKFVARMLEEAGYAVETAADGEDALRKIHAFSYKLVITDLEMPKVNGFEVLQALRSRPQTQALPVIVMTTRAGEKHRQAAMGMGASAYVTKPVEERALIAEISRWVSTEMGVRS